MRQLRANLESEPSILPKTSKVHPELGASVSQLEEVRVAKASADQA